MTFMLRRLAPPLSLLLLACGDDGTTTAGQTTTSTGPDPTSTTTTPTTSTSTPADTTEATTGSGGMTGTSSSGDPTTDATDTALDDTGTSTTSTTSTGPDDTTTTSTTSTGPDDTSTSSTTATTDSSTTDTTTGDPATSCLDVDFPVTAPLCGDAGPTCQLLRDEVISPDETFRNDMPAIALRGDCGPAVIYSVAVNGYHGFYAERAADGTWALEPTPMPIATGSLEADPGQDAVIATVDDGAFGVTTWVRSNNVWAQHSALVGMNHSRAPQLARDGQGRLHLGHVDAAFNVKYDLFDAAWTPQLLLDDAEIHVRIALDPQDAAHLTSWVTADATWKMHYFAPSAAPEVVTALGSNVLERHHSGLVLVGDDATPWVLLARRPDGVHHAIVLAHRTGPGAWTSEVLVAEDASDDDCQAPPQQPGQTCDFDFRRVFPTALVAGAADVRALYVREHHQGTYVAVCEPGPQPFCFWSPQTEAATADLLVAWPGAAPAEHQIVADDVFTDRATARLDPAGAVHLAFYNYTPGSFDPIVRYVMLGG